MGTEIIRLLLVNLPMLEFADLRFIDPRFIDPRFIGIGCGLRYVDVQLIS